MPWEKIPDKTRIDTRINTIMFLLKFFIALPHQKLKYINGLYELLTIQDMQSAKRPVRHRT